MTFLLEVASTTGGPWSILSTIPWPAGATQTAQLLAGVNGQMVHFLNPTAAYVRLRVATLPPQPGSSLPRGSRRGSRSFGAKNNDPLEVLVFTGFFERLS